jgi:hypothetical protein
MENQCYVCSKETEEDIAYLGDGAKIHKKRKDENDISFVANIYIVKKGFFSKEKIIICKTCLANLKKLFGNDIDEGIMHPTTLKKETVNYINKNTKKIVDGDFSDLPVCTNCKEVWKNMETFEELSYDCDTCNLEYCSCCATDSENMPSLAMDYIYDKGLDCPNQK